MRVRYLMANSPLPKNESGRLRQLEALGIMDTSTEEAFDRITRIAAHTLGGPTALITLVDANRQWFKSKIGVGASQMPREGGFCSHAICCDDIMEVEDATQDEHFAESPIVKGDPNIRFYAGAPLHFNGTFNLGTLCIIDTKPRSLTKEERSLLKDLAAMVTEQLELHRTTQRAIKAEKRLNDAVEAIPDGFILYDKNDELVMCNQRFKDIYSESADLFVQGAKFIDIIRQGVERGQYPEAIGNEETWIEKRLSHHNKADSCFEQQLPGDRWLQIQERHTRDGYLLGFRADITQLKRCLLYTSPSPRDQRGSRMPSSA